MLSHKIRCETKSSNRYLPTTTTNKTIFGGNVCRTSDGIQRVDSTVPLASAREPFKYTRENEPGEPNDERRVSE